MSTDLAIALVGIICFTAIVAYAGGYQTGYRAATQEEIKRTMRRVLRR